MAALIALARDQPDAWTGRLQPVQPVDAPDWVPPELHCFAVDGVGGVYGVPVLAPELGAGDRRIMNYTAAEGAQPVAWSDTERFCQWLASVGAGPAVLRAAREAPANTPYARPAGWAYAPTEDGLGVVAPDGKLRRDDVHTRGDVVTHIVNLLDAGRSGSALGVARSAVFLAGLEGDEDFQARLYTLMVDAYQDLGRHDYADMAGVRGVHNRPHARHAAVGELPADVRAVVEQLLGAAAVVTETRAAIDWPMVLDVERELSVRLMVSMPGESPDIAQLCLAQAWDGQAGTGPVVAQVTWRGQSFPPDAPPPDGDAMALLEYEQGFREVSGPESVVPVEGVALEPLLE